MYKIKYESILLTKLFSRRFVSSSKNLYDVLGITPSATQADIKSAYYKLSKAYHPDTNKTEGSGDKFRLIKEAYEVLGNYRLRKLYDKGIIHTAGTSYAHHSRPHHRTQAYDMENEVDEDPTTKFYKSRLRQEHTGKTRVYDFDQWTQAHYGETFKKQQETKKRQIFKQHRDIRHKDKTGSRYTMFSLVGFLITIVIIAEYLTHVSSLDVVDPTNIDSYKIERENINKD